MKIHTSGARHLGIFYQTSPYFSSYLQEQLAPSRSTVKIEKAERVHLNENEIFVTVLEIDL